VLHTKKQHYKGDILSDLFLNIRGKTLNIAHRGASAKFIENTMPAFRAAVELQADMIELDVHLSKDGIPVVFHNDKIPKKTSNGGDFVKNYTFAELQAIDLEPSSENGTPKITIPSLEEVLQFAKGKISLNIEIKAEVVTDNIENGVEQKCIQLLEKYGMLDHVLFSSYDMRCIQHIKQLDPGASLAVLYSKQLSGNTPAQIVQHYKADAFHCTYHQLSKKWLKNLKTNNIPVLVYTINRPARMKKLIKMGVNGIFTDKPDVLSVIIKKFESG
jgi:glycerophosphoryl diester phosphodiesterase